MREEMAQLLSQEKELIEKLDETENEIIHTNCLISLAGSENEKLKSKYIKNEKKSNKIDQRIQKLQSDILKILDSTESTQQKDAPKEPNDLESVLDFGSLPVVKRKCRSYHGSPEKLKWRQETEEAVTKAKEDLELALSKLKEEYKKLSEMEGFLKKKAKGVQE